MVSLEELLSATFFAQDGSWTSSLLTADPVLESFLSKVGGNDTREMEQEKRSLSPFPRIHFILAVNEKQEIVTTTEA